jgi:thiol-disulfide isomerase/thioredoxin
MTLLTIVAISACTSAPVPAPPPPGEPTAETFAPVSTEQLRAAAWASGPRVVNLWATWCQPCVREMPLLLDVAGRHPGVELLFVNVDGPAAPAAKLSRFAAEHGLQGARHVRLVEADPITALAAAFPGWDDVVPFTVVVDAAGKERGRWVGVVDADALDRALSELH